MNNKNHSRNTEFKYLKQTMNHLFQVTIANSQPSPHNPSPPTSSNKPLVPSHIYQHVLFQVSIEDPVKLTN